MNTDKKFQLGRNSGSCSRRLFGDVSLLRLGRARCPHRAGLVEVFARATRIIDIRKQVGPSCCSAAAAQQRRPTNPENISENRSDAARWGHRALPPAFTLLELLVVISTLAILAALLLPTLASTKQNSQAAQCLENNRRLVLAWRMYAEDNSGILAPNDYPYLTSWFSSSAAQRTHMKSWVVGTMADSLDIVAGTGLANGYNELLDRNGTLLAPYIQDKQIYHCPADQYLDPNARRIHPRSYSMNSAVGTVWYTFYALGSPPLGSAVQGGNLPGNAYNANQTTWLTYGKISSFTRPGPANTFLIMDEHPYSINDCTMNVAAAAAPGATYLIDFPSGNHGGAGCLSFADGHALVHKWQDRRTYNPPTKSPITTHQSPDDPDCFFLAPITSAPR